MLLILFFFYFSCENLDKSSKEEFLKSIETIRSKTNKDIQQNTESINITDYEYINYLLENLGYQPILKILKIYFINSNIFSEKECDDIFKKNGLNFPVSIQYLKTNSANETLEQIKNLYESDSCSSSMREILEPLYKFIIYFQEKNEEHSNDSLREELEKLSEFFDKLHQNEEKLKKFIEERNNSMEIIC
jgi:hypothetical protein